MYLFGRKSLGAELRGFCAFARVSTAELRRTRVRNEHTPGRFRSSGRACGRTCFACSLASSERSGALLYGPRSRAKYKRAVPVLKIAVPRAVCTLLANELSGCALAGRKSWIELLRVLFLDALV